MRFTPIVFTFLAVGASLASPTSFKRSVDFGWGSEKIRGVNIGGWLVLEPWITPSIFEAQDQSLGIVDEYTLCERLGYDAASNILRQHWDSWVGYEDFARIASYGFNVVRIPIGYWAYETFGSPYVQGAADYIDAAVDWARGAGLKIMIDLHGAPRSQNGFDNSGQRLDFPGWTQGDTVDQTLQVIRRIAEKYAREDYQDVVIGLELLNEPQGGSLDQNIIRQFNWDGIGNVRTVSDTTVIFSDAFLHPSSYNGLYMPDAGVHNVAVDHHYYQVFDPNTVAWEQWQHRQAVCNDIGSYDGSDKWLFIGEWTGAMTDCAKYLNGYGEGARYDGTFPGSWYVGSCDTISDLNTWPDWYRDDVRGFIEAQLDAFEAKTQGWVFWNFKTEGSAEWDMYRLVDAGIFPQPLDDRRFDPVCSNL
ncbi:putative Exo-beta-1,3-glucanase [Lineolata rhizophorae]|uniref:glucan 1,3-beta-glucosidase n=1 Tax=Lineolata rhizophorae TaxID=578093 RepID=A0A6A6NSS4_9PEZI|nr:putative Exo-beta-1,3-glucanase [Lineolata rhizophorae]